MYPWPAPLVTITLPPGRTTSMRRAPEGAWTIVAPPYVRTTVGWPEGAKRAELPLEPWNSGRGPGPLPALFEPKLRPALLFVPKLRPALLLVTGPRPTLLFVPRLRPALILVQGPLRALLLVPRLLPALLFVTGPLPALLFVPKLLPVLPLDPDPLLPRSEEHTSELQSLR